MEHQLDRHKTLLTRLYLDEDLTAAEIRHHMSNAPYGVVATLGQYERKFRSWKLDKHIGAESWMALGREFQRYNITLGDIDDEHGTFEVLYKGRPLRSSKVKKALYRYNTSLLHNGQWCNAFEPWYDGMTNASNLLYQDTITKCLMRDHSMILGEDMGETLVLLALQAVYTKKLSTQLTQGDLWSLRKKSSGRHIPCFTSNQQLAFVSCMLSSLPERLRMVAFRDNDKTELVRKFKALLVDSGDATIDVFLKDLQERYEYHESHRMINGALYCGLACYILTRIKHGVSRDG